MPLLDGFPGVSGATDFGELRKLFAGLIIRNASGVPRAGILRDKTGPIVSGRGDLSVDVGRFPYISVRDGGAIFGLHEGTTQVPIPALPTSNKRIDILWVRQNISDLGDPTDLPQFGWTTGDAAAIPEPPTTPLPAGAVEVARVQVSVGTTVTNDAAKVTITQTAWNSTGLAGTSIPFPTLGDLTAWKTAARGQLARVDGLGGDWRWSGTRWIPLFTIVGMYSWRNNVQHQGTEFPFNTVTPQARAGSSDFASEVFTLGPGGWTAKFDMYVHLSSMASNRIGATPQSLAGRSFWRPKVAGSPVDRFDLSSPYELEKTVSSQVLLLRAGEQLSANAYQDTVGTTVTMVLDPTLTYLGPA